MFLLIGLENSQDVSITAQRPQTLAEKKYRGIRSFAEIEVGSSFLTRLVAEAQDSLTHNAAQQARHVVDIAGRFHSVIIRNRLTCKYKHA